MGFLKNLWRSFKSSREDFAVDKATKGLELQVRVIEDIKPTDKNIEDDLLEDYSIGYIGSFINYFASSVKSGPLETHFLENRIYGEIFGGRIAENIREKQKGLMFHQNKSKDLVISKNEYELSNLLLLGARDGFEDAQRFGASESNKPRRMADHFIKKYNG